MNELKTLKDLEDFHSCFSDDKIIFSWQVKLEAIKWVKTLRSQTFKTREEFIMATGEAKSLTQFFNLIEDDLK